MKGQSKRGRGLGGRGLRSGRGFVKMGWGFKGVSVGKGELMGEGGASR